MSNRIIKLSICVLMMAAPVAAAPAPPIPATGTICVTVQTAGDDSFAKTWADAASKALDARGFTILNDPAHAAFGAEVAAIRTEVGTSVIHDRATRPLATGGGVNIPLAPPRPVLAPLQRMRIEVRIRRRGIQSIIWQGAAVTVRPIDARGVGAEDVAFALAQAALSSYPTQTTVAITVP